MLSPGLNLLNKEVVSADRLLEGVSEGGVGEGETEAHVFLVHPPQEGVAVAGHVPFLLPRHELPVTYGVNLGSGEGGGVVTGAAWVLGG